MRASLVIAALLCAGAQPIEEVVFTPVIPADAPSLKLRGGTRNTRWCVSGKTANAFEFALVTELEARLQARNVLVVNSGCDHSVMLAEKRENSGRVLGNMISVGTTVTLTLTDAANKVVGNGSGSGQV